MALYEFTILLATLASCTLRTYRSSGYVVLSNDKQEAKAIGAGAAAITNFYIFFSLWRRPTERPAAPAHRSSPPWRPPDAPSCRTGHGPWSRPRGAARPEWRRCDEGTLYVEYS